MSMPFACTTGMATPSSVRRPSSPAAEPDLPPVRRAGARTAFSDLEQVGQLPGIGLRVVAVAVVEQDMRGRGVVGQRAHFGRPFAQLAFGVAVAEPLVDVLAGPLV